MTVAINWRNKGFFAICYRDNLSVNRHGHFGNFSTANILLMIV